MFECGESRNLDLISFPMCRPKSNRPFLLVNVFVLLVLIGLASHNEGAHTSSKNRYPTTVVNSNRIPLIALGRAYGY